MDASVGRRTLDRLEDDRAPRLSGSVFDHPSASPEGSGWTGHWFCLDLVLHPKKKLLGIPKGIVWPYGAERLLGAAIPAGRGLSELLTTGRYEIVGAD